MAFTKRFAALFLAVLLILSLSACGVPATTAPETTAPETTVPIPTADPYVGMTAAEFYANYTPATCQEDALYRSQHGFLSGSLKVSGQYAVDADYQPTEGGKYIRNTGNYYLNEDTYVVVNAWGEEVMRIYRGGGYITLEEVAAYMYAFGGANGSLPANYTSKKSAQPSQRIWGDYLRVNHSYFKGDTKKYPYEPELPNISGCGGKLQYFELDIGTTGTQTPGNYAVKTYNDGRTITRGAARLVYARQDKNRNGTFERDEVYVFYTDNHYNDFREYLNYYGGWGEIFGNITGGGQHSSKTNYNHTPYVPTAYAEFILDQAA